MRRHPLPKTILISGSTEGIGELAAEKLAADGRHVIVHGRSLKKLETVVARIGAGTESELADFAALDQVAAMAERVLARHGRLDVLINNAGVLKAPKSMTESARTSRT